MPYKKATSDSVFKVTREAFSLLTKEQRLDIMSEYCLFCGESQTEARCHCMTDE